MMVRVEEARARVEEAMEKLGGLATALTTLVEAGEAQAQAALDSQAVEDAAEPAPQLQAKGVTAPSEAAPTRPKIGDTKKAPTTSTRTVTTRSQAARHMSTEREPRPSRGATESPFNKQMADYLNGLTDDMPLFQHRAQASHAEQMVITGNFSGDPERREEVRDEIRIFRQSQQKP
jgi:hypothetical protein